MTDQELEQKNTEWLAKIYDYVFVHRDEGEIVVSVIKQTSITNALNEYKLIHGTQESIINITVL